MRYEQTDEHDRKWCADAMITTSGLAPMLKTRLTCTRGKDSEICRSVLPDYVFQTAKSVGLLDAGRLTGREVIAIQNARDTQDLIDLIKDPARTLPVIVVSQAGRFQAEASKPDPLYLVDVKQLVPSMAGVAHVATLSTDASWALSSELSRPWSVYNGGVRTYLPNFNPNVDHLSHHYLHLADMIRTTDSPKAFLQSLIQRTYDQSVQSMDSQENVPSFISVKEDFLRKSEKNVAAEREALLQKLHETREFANGLEKRALKAEESLQEVGADLERVLKFAAQMRQERDAALKASGQWKANAMEMTHTTPKTIADVGEWAATYFADRLEFTNRALRQAERHNFKDVRTFYRAMLLLATHYYDATIRKDPAAAPLLDEGKKELQVEIHKQFAANKKATEESLLAQTPSGTHSLNMSLQIGRTCDPERLLRVQFRVMRNRILIGGLATPKR